jgi:hypothetical protein
MSEQAKTPTDRAEMCEENARRVTDPILQKSYAHYWRKKATVIEQRGVDLRGRGFPDRAVG